MSWKDIIKEERYLNPKAKSFERRFGADNNMKFIIQQRNFLEDTSALTKEQKLKLFDALDAMRPFVGRDDFYAKYIKPYLEMQKRLQ
jgi:hypothetical protein